MLCSPIIKAQAGIKMNQNDKTKKSNTDNSLGRNIISCAPFVMSLTTIDQEMPDMSIGISYEHISANGYVGYRLPVIASLYNPYYYFMPGIKLYPGKQGAAKYGIGPQLLIGTGRVNAPDTISPFTGQYSLVSKPRTQFGFMLNNSFNFTIASHVYVGLDLSFGVIYYDTEPNAIYNADNTYQPANNNSSRINPSTQISFSMGYRF